MLIRRLIDWWQENIDGCPVYEIERAGAWRSVRAKHLAENPVCSACGNENDCEVHHIHPYFLFPESELSPGNLLTLCSDGPGGMNCHLVIGHAGDWHGWNPSVEADAARFRLMLRGIKRTR